MAIHTIRQGSGPVSGRLDEAARTLTLRPAVGSIGALSVGAVAFLLWLIYAGPGSSSGGDGAWAGWITAALNATSATFVVAGWWHVRAGRIDAHRRSMLRAVGASAGFLVVYVVHHVLHGDIPYPGDGSARIAYLAILAVHVVLATAALPLVLTTAWSALADRRDLHRALARRVAPLWLVASVTGVLVTVLLNLA